jgi:hypothetical protein
MKIIKDILMLLVFLIAFIYGLLKLTTLISKTNFTPEFFSTMSSISTSIASVGGLLLLIVTFLYLIETRKIAVETTKQRKLLEEPAVSIRVLPDSKDPNFLFLALKNTGGGAAYDISVEFKPDLTYRGTSLNSLNMFRNMPVLEKGDESSFFFDSAVQYFKSDNPRETKATITYYNTPKNKKTVPIIREVIINFEERKGQLHLSRRDMNDLVNEIEELKQTLLVTTVEKRNDKYDRKSFQVSSASNNITRATINYRQRRRKKRNKVNR